jgi:hypothetical protein
MLIMLDDNTYSNEELEARADWDASCYYLRRCRRTSNPVRRRHPGVPGICPPLLLGVRQAEAHPSRSILAGRCKGRGRGKGGVRRC